MSVRSSGEFDESGGGKPHFLSERRQVFDRDKRASMLHPAKMIDSCGGH